MLTKAVECARDSHSRIIYGKEQEVTKTIWKFPLETTDVQEIQTPANAKMLSVGLDPEGALCLWALVNPKEDLEAITVNIVGTGNPVPRSVLMWSEFLGTVTDGPYVWHVFYT